MDISGLYDSLKSVKHSVENKIGKSISTESFREALDYCSQTALRNNKNASYVKILIEDCIVDELTMNFITSVTRMFA